MGELDVRGLELYEPEGSQFKQSEFFDVYCWADNFDSVTQERYELPHKLFMAFCIYDKHHVIDKDGTLYRRDTGKFVKHTDILSNINDEYESYFCRNHKEMKYYGWPVS